MAIHNTRYGAHYWNRDEVDTYESSPNDLYRYTAFIGNQKSFNGRGQSQECALDC